MGRRRRRRPGANRPNVSRARASADGSSAGRAVAGAAADCTRLLFENARLRVSDFRLPPGAGAVIEHLLPAVRWQVGGGEHTLGGTREAVVDKQVHFVQGATWNVQNEAAWEYRQIVFEFLGPPQRSEEEVQRVLAASRYPIDVGTELLFENHLCRCWDFYLPPGGSADVHQHTMDYAFVCVAPSRLIGFHPDGEVAFDDVSGDGQVTWAPTPNGGFEHGGHEVRAESVHSAVNGYKDKPMREYLVELK